MYEFKNIPQELKNAPQWILWRSEERDGKKTKVPYQIDGSMAQSSNKRTWSTFPTVLKFYNDRDYDGIGFMFSKDDPFIGIDIDHCVEDGVLSPFAEEIVQAISSYTEYSPSGEGVHIITKGKIPLRGQGTGRKNPELGLEVYRHGRYFTFTGNSLGIGAIEERTDKLKELFNKYLKDKKEETKSSSPPAASSRDMNNLSNKEIWERMFNSKNGKSIQDLFNGHLINEDHSATDMALCNHLAFWTDKDTSKMDSMFRETGLYREKWDRQHSSDGATYGEMTIAAAVYSTHKTISDLLEEQQEQPYEVYISHPDNSQVEDTEEIIDTPPVFHLTELGNAERIVYYHGKNIRYCNELDWLIWNGKRWEEDSKRKIEAITAKTLRALYGEAESTEDKFRKKQLNDWAKKCERRSIRINSILDVRPMVSVKKKDFDSFKFLFNCVNGVIDLKTGELRPHDRDLLLTKMSPIPYEKDANCPNWIAFLESIFLTPVGDPDHELIEYLQKAIGYSLTGVTKEQIMFFLFGNGRNGKSTFINVIQDILGDYARQTNSDTFLKKKNDSGINNDVARLDGARFVSAVESEEGQQLSEALVKQITGGEKMSARFLRQEYFEFTPEFKVFFTTNHKPIIKGGDNGIWRRIKLIPFTVTIPEEKIDADLPEKLKREMPGILRWIVDGCLKWQKEGLKDPKAIRNATQGYREDMDILGPFINENCTIHEDAKIEAKTLYENYKKWCFQNDEIDLKNRSFYRQLEVRGYKKENGAKNKVYFHGLTLNQYAGPNLLSGVKEEAGGVNLVNQSEEDKSPTRKKL
ncbi:phage/plasmid primase, P4 family [Bacillus safensis]|uniref:phage/plasmid primase, P4 family n=1 Tax=Bacillus safensis TaxID=561879 RepID=UPI00227DEC5F|nr:phage/plasmid primase, P4 family [Bacillus safensis]MCY7566183.1 phage/plasmid primase, P4 family [Bacillus safensis]MCY7634798.1 phage/plasmid primase, P4 family [Bacillus safensis]MCY7648664.1 phage/plasmid primase, P4 family [Bacillus safensis]MEC3671317.1 phage/plasmid primase, P4 family [Bacillus safensis]MEC3683977.1 phage/plasmid primase, P4 family [Bacillus safensis]